MLTCIKIICAAAVEWKRIIQVRRTETQLGNCARTVAGKGPH